MEKHITDRIGYVTAVAISKIGNSLNLSTLVKPYSRKYFNIKKMSDNKALEQDWIKVGNEVRIAIGRMEKEIERKQGTGTK